MVQVEGASILPSPILPFNHRLSISTFLQFDFLSSSSGFEPDRWRRPLAQVAPAAAPVSDTCSRPAISHIALEAGLPTLNGGNAASAVEEPPEVREAGGNRSRLIRPLKPPLCGRVGHVHRTAAGRDSYF